MLLFFPKENMTVKPVMQKFRQNAFWYATIKVDIRNLPQIKSVLTPNYQNYICPSKNVFADTILITIWFRYRPPCLYSCQTRARAPRGQVRHNVLIWWDHGDLFCSQGIKKQSAIQVDLDKNYLIEFVVVVILFRFD